MDREFDIQEYMTHGVERVVGEIVRATLRNPRESAYMARFALASRSASGKRRKAERRGEHIPPFLIASITSKCNLHCAGCYSRCNHATVDAEPVRQLTAEEWGRIFGEADGLGISFILLAGGEPMIRRDVIEAAGKRPNILFPVFTNGTFMDERYFRLFDKCRNIVPVMSIEGEKKITDARRGEGVYDRLISNMDELHRRGLIFGASVTVTTRNVREVSSEAFLKKLSDLYHLDRYKDEIVAMDKMGEKSYQNLIAAVEKSREANLARLIYGLGIPNVGLSNAKLIVRHFDQDPEACFEAPFEELCEIDKIGAVIAESYVAFFADSVHREELDALLKELTLVREESDLPHDLEGKTFVITGSLESYPNRDALKKEIEDRGGKVAGSVSAKTSFLINNDITSTSGKNKKAKELGVPIITEAEYIAGDFDKSKENA